MLSHCLFEAAIVAARNVRTNSQHYIHLTQLNKHSWAQQHSSSSWWFSVLTSQSFGGIEIKHAYVEIDREVVKVSLVDNKAYIWIIIFHIFIWCISFFNYNQIIINKFFNFILWYFFRDSYMIWFCYIYFIKLQFCMIHLSCIFHLLKLMSLKHSEKFIIYCSSLVFQQIWFHLVLI